MPPRWAASGTGPDSGWYTANSPVTTTSPVPGTASATATAAAATAGGTARRASPA